MMDINQMTEKNKYRYFKSVENLGFVDDDIKITQDAYDLKGKPMRELTHEELRSYEGYFDIERFNKAMEEKTRIRSITSMMYDMQQLRIGAGNRVVQSFNIQVGQEPGMRQDEIEKETKKALDEILKEYDLVSEAISEKTVSLKKLIHEREIEFVNKDGAIEHHRLQYIKDTWDYDLVKVFDNLYQNEKKMVQILQRNLNDIPIYREFLSNVTGIGPMMAGVIIGYFDIYQAKYVSSFVKYTGIDTVPDENGVFKGRTRNKEHQITRKYIDANGNVHEKASLTFNPFVKTKLVGVLPDVFIKTKSDYATCFFNYMNRKKNDPAYKDYSYPHLKKMANRFMIKQFLKDLFVNWKRIEGLPCPPSYEEEYLNMAPHHWEPLEEYKKAHPEQFVKKDKSSQTATA